MNKVQTLFALLAVACQLLAQNSITIDTQTSLGKVSPGIFGQFIEYMGRDIEGDIYDPKSPLSDANGIRQDVLAKAKELAPTMIRFPGGTFVNWMAVCFTPKQFLPAVVRYRSATFMVLSSSV